MHQGQMNFFDGCLNLIFIFQIHSFVHKNTTRQPFRFFFSHQAQSFTFPRCWPFGRRRCSNTSTTNTSTGRMEHECNPPKTIWVSGIFLFSIASLHQTFWKKTKEGVSSCAVPFSRSHVPTFGLCFVFFLFVVSSQANRNNVIFWPPGQRVAFARRFEHLLPVNFYLVHLCFCIDPFRF